MTNRPSLVEGTAEQRKRLLETISRIREAIKRKGNNKTNTTVGNINLENVGYLRE